MSSLVNQRLSSVNMHSCLFSLVWLFLSSRLTTAVEPSGSVEGGYLSNMVTLRRENFTETIAKDGLTVVKYFADWCGYCRDLAPAYEEAASILKDDSRITVASVDCEADADLCFEQSVFALPTIKLFHGGEGKEYNGTRSAGDIASYARRYLEPTLSVLTAEDESSFARSDDVVLVARLDRTSTTYDEDERIFGQLAQEQREFVRFGVVPLSDSSKTKDFTIYQNWDNFSASLQLDRGDKMEKETLETFITRESLRVMGEIEWGDIEPLKEAKMPVALLFLHGAAEEEKERIESIREVGKQYRGKINFAWSNSTKNPGLPRSANVQTSRDAISIIDFSSPLVQPATPKYPMDRSLPVDASSVAYFVSRFLGGELQPHIRSLPVPSEAEQSDGVRTIVADSLEQELWGKTEDKDVLIMFMAPWCGHCKKLKPVYEELGRLYSNETDKIMISRYDAHNNDIPTSLGFQIQSYPTFKFKPAGSKTLLDYDGGREVRDFVSFIQQSAANEIQHPVIPGSEQVGDGTSSAEGEKRNAKDEL
ncbi:thioredoxin-like protein [Atractiella rhizophila]|nr:thioredoxin-like protein [Atractiella rhizophila]